MNGRVGRRREMLELLEVLLLLLNRVIRVPSLWVERVRRGKSGDRITACRSIEVERFASGIVWLHVFSGWVLRWLVKYAIGRLDCTEGSWPGGSLRLGIVRLRSHPLLLLDKVLPGQALQMRRIRLLDGTVSTARRRKGRL